MTAADTLLAEILEFCRARKMAPSTFGKKAANAGHLVKRLEKGAAVRTTTLDRVREYIEANKDRAA